MAESRPRRARVFVVHEARRLFRGEYGESWMVSR